MPASSLKLEQFLAELSEEKNQEQQILKSLKGFFSFFPFSRLSLFSYSPINYMSELLFFLQSDGSLFPSEKIREDVRNVPPVFSAIHNRKASYIELNPGNASFPEKYVEKYKLSSLLVVPLKKGSMVIGCVLIDGYTGKKPFQEPMLKKIEEYFRLAFNSIVSKEAKVHHAKLSNREIQVLEMLSIGLDTKEMAGKMAISEFTARDYISSAMKKLGVRHRAQAIAVAVRSGLIS
ncbi:response regulator transcription factor [Planococcus chinensis]|uniref:Response regulator transcription factor n=1 Tax=Planococcus chinensis TaxID=272917 RepID=A0ABW4QJF4_9BACL